MSVRRIIQWPLQRALVALSHLDLYVVRGMHRSERIEAERFLRARYWSIATDYVRNGTLELLCREVQEVPGSIAELGVYRGDFAALMHANLPDRRIHLFDTFNGFDDRDREVDDERSWVTRFHDFSDTSMDAVRQMFPEHAEVIFHRGWFPETTHDVADDERFALVSLDADLYQPMLAGLRWFWERMTPGGYILIHDYNNGSFTGTKVAAREFVASVVASYCPIPDWGGTAVIGKPIASGRIGEGVRWDAPAFHGAP